MNDSAAAKAAKREELSRNVSWILLCLAAMFVSAIVLGLALMTGEDSFHPRVPRNLRFVGLVIAAFLPALFCGFGLRYGWNTRRVLNWSWLAVFVFGVLAFMMAQPMAAKARPASLDRAVLNNVRQLAAAADQYFLERGATVCAFSDLVGPDKYVKAIHTVAHETYPDRYAKGMTLTVKGVAGVRTFTYAR